MSESNKQQSESSISIQIGTVDVFLNFVEPFWFGFNSHRFKSHFTKHLTCVIF